MLRQRICVKSVESVQSVIAFALPLKEFGFLFDRLELEAANVLMQYRCRETCKVQEASVCEPVQLQMPLIFGS